MEWLWAAFMAWALWPSRTHLADARRSYARLRSLMLMQAFAIVLSVFVVSVLLLSNWPALQWSWFMLLGAKPTNLNVEPFFLPYVGWLFFVLVVLALPRLARAEEKMFRKGTKTWGQAVRRSLVFGGVHCLVGVPIGVGLVLSAVGLWFTRQYFKGGVERATLHHLAYNCVAVALMAFHAAVMH